MKEFLLQHGEDLQVAIFFFCVIAFLLLERAFPRRHTTGNQSKRWQTNVVLTVLAILFLPLTPISFIVAALWAEQNGFGLLNLATLPLPVVIIGTLLLRGFVSFATHFLNHKVPVLWRLHRVHHLDTELDVSSTVRFHPLEMPVSALIGVPLIAMFGLSPWVLLFYELLDASVTVFSHSNLRLPQSINRWLRYIIVTPDLHRVHHSTHQPETDSNFSAVFPIWDMVFGTFRTTTNQPQETMPLGLENIRDERSQDIRWLLISPIKAIT